MEYKALGLKCGPEVHPQLDPHKLFCECPSLLSERTEGTFVRRLRPTQSEMGEVDAAAIEEAKRHLAFVYQVTDNSCLVEADEEPPHEANGNALETGLLVSLMFRARPVGEVHFIRKLGIDGSNTTGFQRSALIAVDGSIEVDGKKIGIPTILLEEDAARKVSEAEGQVGYRLDRLGIPLVEIATTPDIASPEEAAKVALGIGSWLPATRRGMRGIGTIREDLKLSIRGGSPVEEKGGHEVPVNSRHLVEEVEGQLALVERMK